MLVYAFLGLTKLRTAELFCSKEVATADSNGSAPHALVWENLDGIIILALEELGWLRGCEGHGRDGDECIHLQFAE